MNPGGRIPKLRYIPGRLARNTAWAIFWQFCRVGGQTLWVIAIARSLGPSGYGAFAGTSGLATALSGLVGVGTGILLLQNTAIDHSAFSSYWRKAELTTLVSGVVLAAVFLSAASMIVGTSVGVTAIISIGLSELVCYPFVSTSAFAFQAHEKLGWSNSLTTMMSIVRLLAVIVFVRASVPHDLATYVWFHLGASILGALYAWMLVRFKFKPEKVRYELQGHEIRKGLSFSATWFTTSALVALDKTLTLRLAGGEIAGIYTAAYRLVSVLTLPVDSLAVAVQPKLFRQRAKPDGSDPRLVLKVVVVATAYAVLASVGILFLREVLPILLGSRFAPSARAATLLVLLPPFLALRLIGGTVLLTSGAQLLRVIIESTGILVLVFLALLWIPKYGLTGAAMAATGTEAALSAAIWGALWLSSRR